MSSQAGHKAAKAGIVGITVTGIAAPLIA